jgi:putative copper resistance protein D
VLPLAATGAAGAAYLAGARRLAARDRAWPPARTIAFLSGAAVVAVATLPPLATHDTTSFTAHMAQHLLLGMLAPLLLALGAPVTLALQASSRVSKRRALRVLHSAPAAVVTHPVVAWCLFAGSLVGLYLTPLYRASVQHAWLHELVHLHFLAAGCLFYWPVVGSDPSRWRLPHGARLAYVLAGLPVHAFIGLALLSEKRPLAPGNTLADQRAGAGIMWAAGEVVGVLTAVVVTARWMQAEDRAAARADRSADAELAAAGDLPAAGAPGAAAVATVLPQQ